MSTVPRRAVFDDLRVGQWVAWIDESDHAWAGRIVEPKPSKFRIDGGAGVDVWVYDFDCHDERVTILRDPPAQPVTVRRADYDALVETCHEANGMNVTPYLERLLNVAGALIDNADTGTTT